MIKGVLLDVDGTLVASNDAHASSWEEAFDKLGYNVPFAKIRPLIGMGGDKLLPTLMPTLESDSEKGKELSKLRRTIFLDKYTPHLQPTKGSRTLVEKLKEKGIKLIVASSASKEELSTLLKVAEVDDLLHEFTTASEVEESKPAPDIVAVALKKIQLPADEVYMIGDTPYDISSARKCRVKVIAVRSGGFADAMLTGAYKIFDDPEDISRHLDELLS